MIKIKRIYDEYNTEDGFRILIDRIWPRGVSKQDASIDLWLNEIAPSNELRKWFNHEAEKWPQFEEKFIEELQQKQDLINRIRSLEKKHKKVTLLYSARDTEHNQAIVLQKLLTK